MTDMNFGFNDMDDVNAHSGVRVTPDSGDYNVMISSIEMVSNSAKNGHNIHVKYSILDGDYAGSEIQEWLAVVNKSETAENIAKSKLKAIYIVTDKKNATGFTDLMGAVLRIRVYKKTRNYTDDRGNEREGFNTEVAMYMSSAGLDINGKEVAPYSGPAVMEGKKADKPKSSGNSYNAGSSYSNSDDDDEIPF